MTAPGEKSAHTAKKVLRALVSKTWKPLLSRYLGRRRVYRYQGLRLIIPPGVFHPGFFFSTRMLLHFLENYALEGKTLLELGAGSGLISFVAARQGAVVTATDVSSIAVAALRINQEENNTRFKALLSNMFGSLPRQAFDFIVINPPYYKRNPQTPSDYAWYCGAKGEYFELLFQDLNHYIYASSVVLMILSEDCDLEMISGFAAGNHFALQKLQSKRIAWEENYIFQIRKTP